VNFFRVVSLRSVCLLCAALAFSTVLRADNWAPNLTATATWHSNATNADLTSDQLESLQLNADILASERYALGRDNTVRLTARFAGDWWPRYSALLRGSAGGRAEFRHQFGPDPLAAVVAIEGAADGVETKEVGRSGIGTAVTIRVSKRLNTLTRVEAWHEVSWYNARLGTYDYGASESALEIHRDLTPVMRLIFAARFRDGDIVTHASGSRPELEDRAPHRTETTTFDRSMTAYRLDAQTWSGRLSIVRAFDDTTAILVGYEHRESRRGPLRFPDHLLSVAIIHQF
jgi:hypothetical protein